MEKKIRKWCPFTIVEFIEEESWLQDQAKKGLLLVERNVLSAVFEESEPSISRRYRILPFSYREMPDDEKELYKSSGWSYVLTSGDRTVLTTDDESAPELFTDKESYIQYHKKMIRNAWLGLLGEFIWLLYITWMLFLGDNNGGIVRFASSIPNIILLIISLSYLTIIFTGIVTARQSWKLLQQIKEYSPEFRRESHRYENAIRERKRIHIILGIQLLVLISLLIIGIPDDTSYINKEALRYSDDSLVYFRSIDPEVWSEYLPFLENTEEAEPWQQNDNLDAYEKIGEGKRNVIVRKSLCETFNVMNVSDDPEVQYSYPSYFEEYIDFRNEWLAKKYLDEEIKDYIKRILGQKYQKSYPLTIKLEYEGLDYVGYESREEYINEGVLVRRQNLYIRNGNRIYNVSYYGDIDLTEKIPLYADKLVKEE